MKAQKNFKNNIKASKTRGFFNYKIIKKIMKERKFDLNDISIIPTIISDISSRKE
jgi:hypothetical protein